MTEQIQSTAPKILALIKASKNILLHCHPFPDPDSVASALATKSVLEQLGKKVTVIRGDTPIPQAFSHFPGFANILDKNFFEIDLVGASGSVPFDLFILQDISSLERVSTLGPVIFPKSLKTIRIDHHIDRSGFTCDISLVEPSYPATALILFELFKLWNIHITPEIAGNLFIGMYTDTGGFKYASVTPATLSAASELVGIYPNFHELIFTMENRRRPGELMFQGIALSNIETFLDGALAMSAVSYDVLCERDIAAVDASASVIAGLLKSVVGWDIGAGLVETEPRKVKVSFRTRDASKYDLSAIAAKLGGGGHKAAAAAVVSGTIAEVKELVLKAVRDCLSKE